VEERGGRFLKSMSRFRNTKPGGGEPAPTLKNTKVTLSNPSQKEEITMKRSMIFAATLFCSGLAAIGPVHAADAPSTQLQIDVPVSMKASKVVFNMDHPTFAGDQSIGLMYMRLMKMNYASAKVPVDIIAVYHSMAGYILLNDEAYNKARKTTRGNPYKAEIAALQAQGVQFEECGQTARTNGWVNADLLPGVKVDTGATLRLVQLVQDGYVQLQP
jgi:intracellular sulfur oxidation DsrE/DsrF family protein